MKTRNIALTLALLALPAVVQAQDYTYTTNNGRITITGYTGPGGDVTIPDTINGYPVTSIGNHAFEACNSLTSVTIPNNVTSIGVYAFDDCTSLAAITVDPNNPSYSSVAGVMFNKSQTTLIQYPGGKAGSYTIPNSVTTVGEGAFAVCYSLTSVTIPNSVISIGREAFDACTSLTSVTIGNSVSGIGPFAFKFCTSLTNVTIPNSVTSIGNDAFQYCSSLTSVTIGTSVTSIGGEVFAACTSLTSVTIPNGVTSIGNDAFQYCISLTNVTIPSSVTSIGAAAFESCNSLTSVTIPNSVTSIGDGAFAACTSLTAITVDPNNPAYSTLAGVLFDKSQTTLIQYPGGKAGSYTIPNGVTSIEFFAFYSCISLTSVTIPNSVTSIGWYAFQYCSSLTNVTIPNSVEYIGDYAFSYCTSLTRVYFQSNAQSLDGFYVFYNDPSVTVYYLPGTTGWGAIFDGLPTALWLPQVKSGDASFGVQTNQFGFNITWASGRIVVVEACTNLGNPIWSPVATNTLTGGTSYFSDPHWTNYPARFYRLRSP